MFRKLDILVLSVAVALFVAAVPGSAQSVMTHHVRDAVRSGQAQATGRLPSNQSLQLDLVLPLSDPAGLEAFLQQLYDPASPGYRQFLTPQQFTARFGPTQEQYDAVLRFAQTYGLQVVGGSRDAMDVQVKGTVGVVEAAFHLNMRTYKHPTENRNFYSPDAEPTVDLPFNLWHISGLDNYSIPRAMLSNRDDFAKAHGIDAEKAVSHATTGSGPSGSFLGTDMRAAYYTNGTLTGAGQTVGLLEYYGTDLADLTTYYANAGQTYPANVVKLYSTDGTSQNCTYPGCDDTEQTLDMTQALGMAPGLSNLVMYIGSTDTAMIGAMTTNSPYPLPGTIGCSWGWTPVDPSTLDPYFQKMAAQGQNFFVASGDSSTWTRRNYPWPAEDANIVSVGGTDLVTGTAGAWSSETAWSDSGGGISPDGIAIPAWQKAAGVINSSNRGSTTYRNGPDVAANANFTFYVCADQKACTANYWGGTSFATPMWAAYVALVNEQLASSHKPGIGFLNPTIYAQNESGGVLTSAYSANFHDISSGTSGSYSAVKGYDLVTGWGSPNNGLLGSLTEFSLSASSSSLSFMEGNGGSTTISSTMLGTGSPSIVLSVSGLPTGVSASFAAGSNPIASSGSSLLTFTAGSAATTGTFIVTVTGVGSDGSAASIPLTIQVTAAPLAFSISSGTKSLTISRGSSGSATITTAVTQGIVSSIALSASGQQSGTSISFSPSSISGGNGNSTMRISVSRNATTGTVTLSVNGSGGGVLNSTQVTLTVK